MSISAATLYRKEGGEADDKEIESGESHLVGDVLIETSAKIAIFQRNVKNLLQFCCRHLDNLSQKMYALNPAGGKGDVLHDELVDAELDVLWLVADRNLSRERSPSPPRPACHGMRQTL